MEVVTTLRNDASSLWCPASATLTRVGDCVFPEFLPNVSRAKRLGQDIVGLKLRIPLKACSHAGETNGCLRCASLPTGVARPARQPGPWAAAKRLRQHTPRADRILFLSLSHSMGSSHDEAKRPASNKQENRSQTSPSFKLKDGPLSATVFARSKGKDEVHLFIVPERAYFVLHPTGFTPVEKCLSTTRVFRPEHAQRALPEHAHSPALSVPRSSLKSRPGTTQCC